MSEVLGLVLTAASAFSESSGLNLYQLEGHNDKLLPNLAKSARLIFSIYLAYRVLGRVLYISFGVKPFDALCHSITALATGGFSTKANSINSLSLEVSLNGQWRGIAIEIVTEVLRLLGARTLGFIILCLSGNSKFFAILNLLCSS